MYPFVVTPQKVQQVLRAVLYMRWKKQ